MMDRRWFLGLLGSIPFMGSSDAMELNDASIEAAEIERPIYACIGDVCVCEQGHPIFEFAKTVHVGETQAPEHFTRWVQPTPQWGAYPIPGCTHCGSPWTDGVHYHFVDGWRKSNHRED